MEPKKKRNLLDEIKPEDLDKLKDHQAKTQGAFPVDSFWLLQAEFAKAFGWEAYMAVKRDEIPLAEMMTLIEAHRKLEYLEMFKQANVSFIGAVSAQTRKPGKTFKSLIKNIITKARVDA